MDGNGTWHAKYHSSSIGRPAGWHCLGSAGAPGGSESGRSAADERTGLCWIGAVSGDQAVERPTGSRSHSTYHRNNVGSESALSVVGSCTSSVVCPSASHAYLSLTLFHERRELGVDHA